MRLEFTVRIDFDRTKWIVTDQPMNWDIKKGVWDPIAEFPFGVRNDKTAQYRRAEEYASYLNRTAVVQPPIS